VPQAGLFSAVTSAFIIQVHSQLQPDPNEETAALLRVLIHTADKTIFGDNAPSLPQPWTGPPRAIVQVQAILYVSIGASLFAAFLAMLGKQWLNLYTSNQTRGPTIERSQNRQRKLKGLTTWYFKPVMELLPLMLQASLLLLGCALSRYVWGLDPIVAGVVLGGTLLCASLYVFIVTAGTASESCPYQTPVAQFFRYLWRKVPSLSTLQAALAAFIGEPTPAGRVDDQTLLHTGDPNPNPDTEQTLDPTTTALDFSCGSWMLQTSLDRKVNQVTLKFLLSVLALPGFEATIVTGCFNVFVSCVSVAGNGGVTVIRGLEQHAVTAATCLLGSVSRLLIEDPRSKILTDVRQQLRRIFPSTVDHPNLPFYHTMNAIHGLFGERDHPDALDWKGLDFSTQESSSLAHHLVKIAWSWYRKPRLEEERKVPRWVLHFSLHSLLSDPEPPSSVIADCSLIIAIGLGCDVSETYIRNPDKRYVHPTQLHSSVLIVHQRPSRAYHDNDI